MQPKAEAETPVKSQAKPAAEPKANAKAEPEAPAEVKADAAPPAKPKAKPAAAPKAKAEPKKKVPAKGKAGPPAKVPPAKLPAKPKPAEDPPTALSPPAGPSRLRTRHWLLLMGFLVLVLAPLGTTAWYLWTRAEDQFVSELGFTVRQEEAASAIELLGGLGNLSSSGSSDTDVLYEYIQSQEMVRLVDEALDLRRLYSTHHQVDPVFSFDPSGSIEDLVAYWRRMVQISYNPGSGMLYLKVFAFEPDTAQQIAEEILKNSSRVINDISAIAREDATRYALKDLDNAKQQLRSAREALTEFRSRTRIVDPSADLRGQMGVLTTLQQQLAAALIDFDLLRENTSQSDSRISQAQLRIEVIRRRIEEERSKFGQGSAGGTGQDYATLVAEFERLTVDREFAEQTYTAALSAFAAAQAEAERQSRYLAPYVRPTLAETAEYPRRLVLLGLTALFMTLFWAILALVYYSLRDRR